MGLEHPELQRGEQPLPGKVWEEARLIPRPPPDRHPYVWTGNRYVRIRFYHRWWAFARLTWHVWRARSRLRP